jgi:hypothetical protein
MNPGAGLLPCCQRCPFESGQKQCCVAFSAGIGRPEWVFSAGRMRVRNGKFLPLARDGVQPGVLKKLKFSSLLPTPPMRRPAWGQKPGTVKGFFQQTVKGSP